MEKLKMIDSEQSFDSLLEEIDSIISEDTESFYDLIDVEDDEFHEKDDF